MSRSRYEPVPQADQEIIELHNDPTYNYNTAIPNSPPPSFHSSQSTPAVSVAGIDFDLEHERAFNNATPRPIPSIIDGSSGAAGGSASSGADAMMLANLHRRVERLEETIGRLLLEKPEGDSSGLGSSSGRSNCCVTFPSASELSDIELAEVLRAPSNCCVRFGRGGFGGARRKGRLVEETDEERARREKRRQDWLVVSVAVAVMFAFLGWVALVVWLRNRPQQGVIGCEACFPTAGHSGEDGSWTSSGR